MKKEEQIPIAIADDHTLFRKGLAEIIQKLPRYYVAAEASNGKELISALSADRSIELALVDLNMPIMDGFEAIDNIQHNLPHVKPIALTFEESEGAVIRAVRSGARAYVLKDAEPEDLLLALDDVRQAGYHHGELVYSSLDNHPDMLTQEEKRSKQLQSMMTARETDFLALVCSAEELTYAQIADRMNVSVKTVDGYRESLFSKYDLKSKTGLVLFAIRWKLASI